METLYHYFVQGIIISGIVEDGGPQCHKQIPKDFHIMAIIFGIIIHVFILYKWRYNIREYYIPDNIKRSYFQIFIGLLSIFSLIMTCYYKIVTGKGLFIFNPCHITLSGVIIMSLAQYNTKFLQRIHVYWQSWLFGAILALAAPHLQGISQFQIFLYYLEHLLILPIGPLVLMRRYGFIRPTFMNQLVSFTGLCLYQLIVLSPFSILTQVNLNFSLCHSPADIMFQYVGYRYFLISIFTLNLLAFISRWVLYIVLAKPYQIGKNLIQGNKVKKE